MIVIIISCVLNALDFISGLIYAFKSKTVSSTKMRDGIFKKSGFVILYALGYIIDVYGGVIGFSFPFDILYVICGYVIITEIVSILENVSKITEDENLINKILEKIQSGVKKE